MMTSNKFIITLLFLTLIFVACGKQEKVYTPAQINQIADSIYKIKVKKLQKQAKDDYDRRLSIELKPKVDSILKNGLSEQPVPVFPDDNIGVDDTDSGPALEQRDTSVKKKGK